MNGNVKSQPVSCEQVQKLDFFAKIYKFYQQELYENIEFVHDYFL